VDWLNGLIGAGIFFLGFFIGCLSMKLARKKEFKLAEKPRVVDIASKKEIEEALAFLEGLPEPDEENKAKELDRDSEEVISDAVNEIKSVVD